MFNAVANAYKTWSENKHFLWLEKLCKKPRYMLSVEGKMRKEIKKRNLNFRIVVGGINLRKENRS